MTTFEGFSDTPHELPRQTDTPPAASELAFQSDPHASDIVPLSAASTRASDHVASFEYAHEDPDDTPAGSDNPAWYTRETDSTADGEGGMEEPSDPPLSGADEAVDEPPRAVDNMEPPGPPKPPVGETGPGPEEDPQDHHPFGVERFEGREPASDHEKYKTADLLSTAIIGMPGLHPDFIDVEMIGQTDRTQVVSVITRLQRELPEGTVHFTSGPDGVHVDFTDQGGNTSYNRYYRSSENTGEAEIVCVRKDTRNPHVSLAALPQPGEVSDFELWQLQAAQRAEVARDTHEAHLLGVGDPVVTHDELRYALGLTIGAHPETKAFTDMTDIIRNITHSTQLPSDKEVHIAAREADLLAERLIARHPGNYAGAAEIVIATPSNLLTVEVSQNTTAAGRPSDSLITLRRSGRATPEEWFKELVNRELIDGDYQGGLLDQTITIHRASDGQIHGNIETTLIDERSSSGNSHQDRRQEPIDAGHPVDPHFSATFTPGPILIRTLRNILLNDEPNGQMIFPGH